MSHRIRLLIKVISFKTIAYTLFFSLYVKCICFHKKDCLWKYCTFPSIWKTNTRDYEIEPETEAVKQMSEEREKKRMQSFIHLFYSRLI
jgi:hypothetical protein